MSHPFGTGDVALSDPLDDGFGVAFDDAGKFSGAEGSLHISIYDTLAESMSMRKMWSLWNLWKGG